MNSSHCIIVIDPQKDFTSDEGAYAKRHSSITDIKAATRLIQQLINEQEKNNTVIVYSNYTANQFGEGLNICIPGTEGHEPGIYIHPSTSILSKQQHSAFSDPQFCKFIRESGYHYLTFCGFLAEYCVKQTALDALRQGYCVSLLKDCIASGDDVRHRLPQTLLDLQNQNAVIISSADLKNVEHKL